MLAAVCYSFSSGCVQCCQKQSNTQVEAVRYNTEISALIRRGRDSKAFPLHRVRKQQGDSKPGRGPSPGRASTSTLIDHFFTELHSLLERQPIHAEMISVTWCFKRILILATQAHRNSIRRWLRSHYSTTACTVHLCSYDLKLNLYGCLHFPQLWVVPCTVCLCKFW